MQLEEGVSASNWFQVLFRDANDEGCGAAKITHASSDEQSDVANLMNSTQKGTSNVLTITIQPQAEKVNFGEPKMCPAETLTQMGKDSHFA